MSVDLLVSNVLLNSVLEFPRFSIFQWISQTSGRTVMVCRNSDSVYLVLFYWIV
jgi:hypothetical protein